VYFKKEKNEPTVCSETKNEFDELDRQINSLAQIIVDYLIANKIILTDE
jgi:hypothetical protein